MDTVTVLTEREKVLKLPAFGYTFRIVLTTSFKGSILKREKLLGNQAGDWDGDCRALCWNVHNRAVTVIFLPFESDVNNIAHESYHGIRNLMKWVSAKDDEEVMAYHIDWLVGEISKFVVKIGTPKKDEITQKELNEIVKKFEKSKGKTSKAGTKTVKIKLDKEK